MRVSKSLIPAFYAVRRQGVKVDMSARSDTIPVATRGRAVVSSSGSIPWSQVDTKLRGDIAEQAAVLQAMKRGWGVLRPVGDRLPYDLVFDVGGALVKVQVKSAWFDGPSGNCVVDNRRTK